MYTQYALEKNTHKMLEVDEILKFSVWNTTGTGLESSAAATAAAAVIAVIKLELQILFAQMRLPNVNKLHYHYIEYLIVSIYYGDW